MIVIGIIVAIILIKKTDNTNTVILIILHIVCIYIYSILFYNIIYVVTETNISPYPMDTCLCV